MSGLLSGLKILDFSTLLPGPFASQILADLGAQVLRIEAPGRPDLVRNLPPFVENVSASHASLNRNKRCMALDLKQAVARDLVLELLCEYDILLEQFRPGVMQKFGLDYTTLQSRFPQLIYCSITGYGQTGAFKNRAGHDINYLALSGLASYSGRANTGPVLSATQIADIAGGSHQAVIGILAAVIHRQLSGKGQAIDISMSDCAIAMHAISGANALAADRSPEAGSEWLNGGHFYDYYETADARYLAIGSLEPQFCKLLLQTLGQQQWLQTALDPAPQAQQQFKSKLQQLIGSETLQHWRKLFDPLDACVEPVLSLQEARQLPHFQQRGDILRNTARQWQSTDANSQSDKILRR